MLSSTYLISASAPTSIEATPSPQDKKNLRNVVLIFFALLIIDLVILVYSMHCILECSQIKKWPMMLTILLMIMIFIPTIGFLVSLGIIIYYHMACKKVSQPQKSFQFY